MLVEIGGMKMNMALKEMKKNKVSQFLNFNAEKLDFLF
jgi:hypothetical protein